MAEGLTSIEIRLLVCSLTGASATPLPSQAHSVASCHETDTLQNAIHCLVSSVERGDFAAALSSRLVKSMLWQPHNSIWASSRNTAHEFYDSVRARIHSFLDCSLDSNGVLPQSRALLVMIAGIAALLAFWQVNVTGPCVSFPPCRTFVIEDDKQILNDKEWNTWAVKQLMVDGCDLVGLCTLPQYLVLAKILLLDSFDLAQTSPSLKKILPSSITWWARRALLANQLILAERSSSMCTLFTTLKPEGFQAKWGINLDDETINILRGAAQLEYGFVEYAYGHIDQARSYFEAAREACGLELALTGALGFRTAHQIDPKAQMVLVASTQLEHVSKEVEQSSTTNLSTDNETEVSTEEDILILPRLVATDTDEPRKQLSGFQQAVILAQCLHVKKSNPDDELRGWQMAPYIEAVDSQLHSHFLIKRCCQLLRIRWECTRSRTKQRALLMLEQLVEDVRGIASSGVRERMCYAFCLQFPTLSVLRKELAEMMVSCGLVGEALQIFEELELWNSLIDCYCLLGKKAAALDLIKERLKQQPDDPRLWCALGDVTLNEDCYEKAWEVSKHRFGRAQRSLGRSAYNKAEYVGSMHHWEAALTLNSMHPDGWFALGSAALKARELDKAVDAFTRSVQLEPENGEAWNNIAAIHMTRKKSKEAFVAFKEALKFKRASWQMWENYAHVALDVQNFGQAIEAMNMVLDLSQGKRNMVDCLNKLMEEVESLYNKEASGNRVTSLSTGHESRSDDLEQGVVANEGILNRSSSPLSTGAANAIDAHATEREWLAARVGKLLTRVVQCSPDSATWGLLARWHRVRGDFTMCAEALLKHVRSLQGSGWQHNEYQFKELCLAALQLCDVYMEVASNTGNKKDLYSVQMLLRNLIKQGEAFSNVEIYSSVVKHLADVQQAIQSLK
ncbi:hypothetical protein GOP47_0001133 [Adiantum capillus-veneris]|uniref:Tetratricopeptide repeat protein 27 homolog n=1 Tax=Adiantum capillus-veneris TaxID=13818 RepID=A0A9D4VF78_ADICA|nr:hypothetical protein GOP47_0001133 [Adiantum capillus-veneris]